MSIFVIIGIVLIAFVAHVQCIEHFPLIKYQVVKYETETFSDGQFLTSQTTWINQPENKVKIIDRTYPPDDEWHRTGEFFWINQYPLVFGTNERGEVACFRGYPYPGIETLHGDYIKTEFWNSRLVDQFKIEAPDAVEKVEYIWFDASTGLPVKRTGKYRVGGTSQITTYYTNFTTRFDPAEMEIPKRLICSQKQGHQEMIPNNHFRSPLSRF